MKFNDNSLMPFGTHKDKPLQDVPDAYLVWVWNENKEEYFNEEITWDKKQALMAYIEDNLDSLDVGDED